MKFGEKGKQVAKAQQTLLDLGFDLGPWGADGILGDATWDAMRDFALSRDLEWTPKISKETLESLENADTHPPPDAPRVEDYLANTKVLDVRGHLHEPQEKARVRVGRTVMRSPSTITGITLHQTAVEYHITQNMLRRADGDFDLAHALRVQRAACHLMALQEGFVVWTRPLRSYVHHGNALNRTTIGIEVEGNYAGLAGKPETAWSGNAYSGPVTEKTVAAARKALLVAVTEGRRAGMPIEYLYAHRQSSGTRRADPGEELWRAVAVEYGKNELGLTLDPKRTFESSSTGKGRPLPQEWDPNGVGSY